MQLPNQSFESGPKKDKTLFLAAVLIIILLLAGFFCAIYLNSVSRRYADNFPAVSPIPSATPEPTITPLPSPESNPMTYVEIRWEKEWIKQANNNCEDNYCEYDNYLAGKVRSDGKYKDQDVYMRAEYGMGTYYRHYVLEAGTPVFFDDNNIKIKGIDDMPEQIDLPGTSYKLAKAGFSSEKFSEIKEEKKLFTDPVVGDVYLAADGGCLVVERPDHIATTYDPIIPFVTEEEGNRYSGAAINITFDNGGQNKEEYTYNRIMGCGALCAYLAVVEEDTLKPAERLVKIGKTSTGEDIFGLKNPNDPALKALYEDKNTLAYLPDDSGELISKSKYTYTQFLSFRPYLYWKDPLGRWIELKNNRFDRAVEMCKPVLYLYPEEKTNLNVRVNPNGGMTYSDPAYNNGWDIEADPSGRIKDQKTGKNYNYLFWEGLGINYPIEDKGWVIKKENLASFFNDKLHELGLRGNEISDFKSYWIGRLGEKPYYKISFLRKTQFDLLAPLDIFPIKPNTVIRVMMTAEGLDRFENIPAQELDKSPARIGFTAVEWGGAVLK